MIPKLCLVFDPSSSLSKGLYCLNDATLKLVTMEPEVIPVPKSSLGQLQQGRVGVSTPENEALVGLGDDYYAVGFLAKTQLYSYENLKQLKYENAVPKVAAMIGVIAQKKRLPSKFGVDLGILLPYGEYQDRLKLKGLLEQALSRFTFNGQSYQVGLDSFHCFPEGGGVLFRGTKRDLNQREKSILVVMLGYRNVSYLLMERGKLTKGETEDLGFSWLINKVKESTSGLKASELIVPITQGGRRVKKRAFKPLLRSQSDSLREKELSEIVTAVTQVRNQHLDIILQWLVSRRFPQMDEVIISGGTADYYRQEIENFFKPQSYHWADHLENKVKELVGESLWLSEFRYRLTDVYGYYFYRQHQLRKSTLGLAG